MNIPRTVSQNPIRTAFSVISAASVIIGAILFIDDRYAHASDFQELKVNQQAILVQQQSAINSLRREQLEDKLFELQVKPKQTTADRALIDRYSNQLHDLQTSTTAGTQK